MRKIIVIAIATFVRMVVMDYNYEGIIILHTDVEVCGCINDNGDVVQCVSVEEEIPHFEQKVSRC